MFQNPDSAQIRALLREVRTIAVVGLSPNPQRPAFRVARALQGFGYRIVPVRPRVAEVLGEKAYASLADVAEKIDLVDVFRAAEHVGPIVDECLRLGLTRIWLQEGVVNENAAKRARAAGMTVVMDRCIWKDRASLPPDPLPAEGEDGCSPPRGPESLAGPALGRPGGGAA
jgi:predicted CoA-binding protein